MKRISLLLSVVLLHLVSSCSKETLDQEPEDLTGVPEIKTDVLLTGFEVIWGMDFLPNGDLIFGEKRGRLYRLRGKDLSEITGFPAVMSNGQGGLLDIKAHPDYYANGWIYATYSASNPSGGALLKLVRFKIPDNVVQNLETIFSTNGSNTWFGHYGSRIAFDSKRYLYLSAGEGGPTSYGGPNTGNNNAQDLNSFQGKIHRLRDDGSIPPDNPTFAGKSNPTPVYSFGHRNPQGLAVNPETDEVWSTEHGPKGGDEINVIAKAANYGWPAYSIGTNYDGSVISAGHIAPGITAPLYTWTPSIGTCGIAFISSSKFKSWKGNLVVSGLATQKLYRCVLEGKSIKSQEVLLSGYGRVRNVIQGPDGALYVSVEDPGRVIKITPE